MSYKIPSLPLNIDLETKAVLKQTTAARSALAELKGAAGKVPNQSILINTLSLQEAKASSAIENIITTHDDLYRADLGAVVNMSPAVKEVQNYAEALRSGVENLQKNGLITINGIIQIYQKIKHNDGGFSVSPDKKLVNEATNEAVYTPPSSIDEVNRMMANLEQFINDDNLCDWDPLVKMAIIHHQFESIHPFSDGNGRAGRVLNVLYLMQKGLLDMPILYLSRYITQTKGEYYARIEGVRKRQEWEAWVIYILRGIEITARETLQFVNGMKDLMMAYKQSIRARLPKIYSQDLINNLFRHPYTKIEFLMEEIGVSRPTAMSYLNQLHQEKLVEKTKLGRENFYINIGLFDLIVNAFHGDDSNTPTQKDM